jgi:hypothetical protein
VFFNYLFSITSNVFRVYYKNQFKQKSTNFFRKTVFFSSENTRCDSCFVVRPKPVITALLSLWANVLRRFCVSFINHLNFKKKCYGQICAFHNALQLCRPLFFTDANCF